MEFQILKCGVNGRKRVLFIFQVPGTGFHRAFWCAPRGARSLSTRCCSRAVVCVHFSSVFASPCVTRMGSLRESMPCGGDCEARSVYVFEISRKTERRTQIKGPPGYPAKQQCLGLMPKASLLRLVLRQLQAELAHCYRMPALWSDACMKPKQRLNI